MRHEMTLPWQKLLDPRTHVRVHQPLRGIVSYLIKCNQIRVHTGKAKSGEEITLWERLTDEEWISIILHFSFHNNGIREMVLFKRYYSIFWSIRGHLVEENESFKLHG